MKGSGRPVRRIVVASDNPVKRRAVEQGFAALFPDERAEILPVIVDSGVADQPLGDAETRRGAEHRACSARSAIPDADLWFGIEGGIDDDALGMTAFAWVVALAADSVGRGRTAEFTLPERIAELVRGGLELGEADDRVFGRSDSKRKDGAIGLLSGGALDRAGLYAQAVLMALLPFRNAALYLPAPESGSDSCGATDQSPMTR